MAKLEESLRRLLDAIEAGEMGAGPEQVRHLQGALAGLEAARARREDWHSCTCLTSFARVTLAKRCG